MNVGCIPKKLMHQAAHLGQAVRVRWLHLFHFSADKRLDLLSQALPTLCTFFVHEWYAGL